MVFLWKLRIYLTIQEHNLKTEGAGFAHDTNVATLLYRDGTHEPLSLLQKDDLASIVLDRLLKLSEQKD